MGVKKGYIPWNKGIKGTKRPKDVCQKISASHMGIKLSPEHCEAIRKAHIGKKLSEEHKKKLSECLKGKRSHAWKGGARINSSGYRILFKPTHPASGKNGYIIEHRYILEKHLNRLLKKDEIAHHINEDKIDNRIENLMVMTRGEHTTHHLKQNGKL